MVVDTAYYEALEVRVDASQDEIRKAYRKMAVRTHPDKNPGDEEAKLRFQVVGEAYQVLGDEKLRALYDKHGKESAVPEAGFEDPNELIVMIFGGEAFVPWIGEISMFKDMMEMANAEGEVEEQTATTEATGTDLVAHQKAPGAASGATASAGSAGSAASASASAADAATATGKGPSGTPAGAASDPDSSIFASSPSSPSGTPQKLTARQIADQKAAEAKAKALRKEKQRELEKKSEEARAQRIEQLTEHLGRKLSSVAEQWSQKYIKDGKASKGDEELTTSFIKQLELEAQELKMESFGIELLHTIGAVYYTRANIYIKSHRSFLGVGGFLSSAREKGSIIKDGWNTLSTAMDAANQIKGLSDADEETLTPEEKVALEQGIMGNVLVAVWAGTRYELQGVLREVADNLLYDHSLDKKVLLARARAMYELGRVFKATQRTPEEAEEVQQFERLVTETMMSKEKKKKSKRSKEPATA